MAGIGSDFTHRLLADAGISSGMQILDVGCGSGDVALIAAGFVGSSGSVLGIDRDAGPLGTARYRASERQLTNVTFVQGDMVNLPSDLGPFDAIVGRRVLMYQPDALEALGALMRRLRPGGMIVLQEHDATMVPASLIPMPLHQHVQGWIRQTIEREGADIHMGLTCTAF